MHIARPRFLKPGQRLNNAAGLGAANPKDSHARFAAPAGERKNTILPIAILLAGMKMISFEMVPGHLFWRKTQELPAISGFGHH